MSHGQSLIISARVIYGTITTLLSLPAVVTLPQLMHSQISGGMLGSNSTAVTATDGLISYFPEFSGFGQFRNGWCLHVHFIDQTRTEELSSWKLFNRGKTLFGPLFFKPFLSNFLINLQCFNFVRSWTGWLSGSLLVLGSLCCSQSSFLLHLACWYVPN